MLTTNQIILLTEVCQSQVPPSTGKLAEFSNNAGSPFGENAARNAMSRLESRGYVVGSGAGRAKTWAATPAGMSALTEVGVVPDRLDPPPADPETPDSDPGKGPRTYVVLEELALADAVREALPDDYALPDTFYEALNGKVIYDKVHSPEARNTEHALRQTAKAVYQGEVTSPPTLVAVADKMFKPTPVRVNNRQTVSIG